MIVSFDLVAVAARLLLYSSMDSGGDDATAIDSGSSE